ncbi:hypothetical protein CHS0354_021293, partial [Potamilus streckersoni]
MVTKENSFNNLCCSSVPSRYIASDFNGCDHISLYEGKGHVARTATPPPPTQKSPTLDPSPVQLFYAKCQFK